ncbi:hypothetical protein THAOC_10874, partial [Thalassiosira oceanica]
SRPPTLRRQQQQQQQQQHERINKGRQAASRKGIVRHFHVQGGGSGPLRSSRPRWKSLAVEAGPWPPGRGKGLGGQWTRPGPAPFQTEE